MSSRGVAANKLPGPQQGNNHESCSQDWESVIRNASSSCRDTVLMGFFVSLCFIYWVLSQSSEPQAQPRNKESKRRNRQTFLNHQTLIKVFLSGSTLEKSHLRSALVPARSQMMRAAGRPVVPSRVQCLVSLPSVYDSGWITSQLLSSS